MTQPSRSPPAAPGGNRSPALEKPAAAPRTRTVRGAAGERPDLATATSRPGPQAPAGPRRASGSSIVRTAADQFASHQPVGCRGRWEPTEARMCGRWPSLSSSWQWGAAGRPAGCPCRWPRHPSAGARRGVWRWRFQHRRRRRCTAATASELRRAVPHCHSSWPTHCRRAGRPRSTSGLQPSSRAAAGSSSQHRGRPHRHRPARITTRPARHPPGSLPRRLRTPGRPRCAAG